MEDRVLLAPVVGLIVIAGVAMVAQAASEGDDVVLLVNGGRVRGTVMEEDPQRGISVRLADGTVRRFRADEVREVKHAGAADPAAMPSAPSPPAAAPPVFAPAPAASTAPGAGEQPGTPARALAPGTAASTPPQAPPISSVPQAVDTESVAPPPPPSRSPWASPRVPHTPGLRADHDTVPAHVGFQMALRLNLTLPGGEADRGEDLSDFFSTQAGGLLEVGGKSSENVFIGGLFGYSKGGVSGALQNLCNAEGISCGSSSYVIGAEVQYHGNPGQQINPWIGMGLAYESATVRLAGPGGAGDVTLSGIQWARLMVGVDVRASEYIGVGGLLEMSLGDYSSIDSSFNPSGQSIPDEAQATHIWFSAGARLVLFP